MEVFVCLGEGERHLGRGNHGKGADTICIMGSGERAVAEKSDFRVYNGKDVGDATDKAGTLEVMAGNVECGLGGG